LQHEVESKSNALKRVNEQKADLRQKLEAKMNEKSAEGRKALLQQKLASQPLKRPLSGPSSQLAAKKPLVVSTKPAAAKPAINAAKAGLRVLGQKPKVGLGANSSPANSMTTSPATSPTTSPATSPTTSPTDKENHTPQQDKENSIQQDKDDNENSIQDKAKAERRKSGRLALLELNNNLLKTPGSMRKRRLSGETTAKKPKLPRKLEVDLIDISDSMKALEQELVERLNAADSKELSKMPLIGPKRAQLILANREISPFTSIGDLKCIGWGTKTINDFWKRNMMGKMWDEKDMNTLRPG